MATRTSSLDKTSQAEAHGPSGGDSLHSDLHLVDESAGVQKITAMSNEIDLPLRIFLFIGVFVISYAYGLDGTIRYTYQPIATASYSQHSLLATINVLRSIVAAAVQPPYAKIADVFGRFELILLSIVFYIVGTIVEATATGVKGFCAGAVLYQFAYSAIILLVEITIGDVTSLRSRLFFSYIPAVPFVINTWVSGDVTQAVLAKTTWRWGIGMWGIIYSVCCLPLLAALFIANRRAKTNGSKSGVQTLYQRLGFRKLVVHLFWELDIFGLILLIAAFSLFLLPFTLAGGETRTWGRPHIIIMLVVGILCIPAFVLWELRFAPVPAIPFKLLNNRTVLSCLGIASLLNCSWYLQGDYLYTVLVVACDESIKSATRITSLYSFTSVLVGVALGIVVRFVQRIKPFMIAGIALYAVAFGLLIRFRGGTESHAGIIAGQVMLGCAGGMFPYPAQALIQSTTQHQHLAIITAMYLAFYNVGSALGNTISGAIWTQVLPGKLARELAPFNNSTMGADVYRSPFEWIAAYPVSTLERQAVIRAYQGTQKILCTVGICLVVPLMCCALLTRNTKLSAAQSLEKPAEGDRTIERAVLEKDGHALA
ncbi:BQ5605_C004g02836 [Microbotryum silenes-dioicae]|uniref:BQ5605_C004g02836 protein n=1 Tax=Microbotryum silenes-dioicae TaxID=796604 RepID=A0A2X0PB02_9BASI|nr:BQ5605_C004g02836 [Microbotryum silenes-dioicae]